MAEGPVPHRLQALSPCGPNGVLGVASRRDVRPALRREHAPHMGYEPLDVGDEKEDLVADHQIDGSVRHPSPLVHIQKEDARRRSLETKSRARPRRLDGLHPDKLVGLPKLRDPGEEPSTVAPDVEHVPRWTGEAVAPDPVDECAPEDLVPWFELVVFRRVLEETRSHGRRVAG